MLSSLQAIWLILGQEASEEEQDIEIELERLTLDNVWGEGEGEGHVVVSDVAGITYE